MAKKKQKKVRAAIEAANQVFMDAAGRGDAAGLAALYTAEGQVLPPNADIVSGGEALQGFWQAIIAMGVKGAVLETLEVEGHGDTAIEVGAYALSGEGGQMLDRGKYIVIWKQEDGQWRLHRDIFNSSLPAPGS
ncbi:MAG: DUF4440 domain-containing protein [Anaerolineae bacterium]|nr:DUF4440 domain-containing protein [Anaerolineae bacterium]